MYKALPRLFSFLCGGRDLAHGLGLFPASSARDSILDLWWPSRFLSMSISRIGVRIFTNPFSFRSRSRLYSFLFLVLSDAYSPSTPPCILFTSVSTNILCASFYNLGLSLFSLITALWPWTRFSFSLITSPFTPTKLRSSVSCRHTPTI
ncbi:hypothetical protein CPB86DRAFT_364193 [Serendipita vermifera]|nr:hypothetical protein CPB86DRAFT_364193 [Serendipita vermifera]